ncbi:hypothetical protein CEXT_203111 [Caerostris extrusa]|uniref:Uncharacterized protein n=1 Tax=Caerostris extrusa TaxID=172846 RepID=A0AAV4XDJ5_CAEEX|nr:hypothetical protein CEXT_203111 [Caerostris extrusa]
MKTNAHRNTNSENSCHNQLVEDSKPMLEPTQAKAEQKHAVIACPLNVEGALRSASQHLIGQLGCSSDPRVEGRKG